MHIPDVLEDPEYTWTKSVELAQFRTMLGVPLLREGLPIGVIALLRRTVRPFTDHQIELVATFADQAVIAIENARLFEAEQQRTRELTESLEQQTATSEVLQVIGARPAISSRYLQRCWRMPFASATQIWKYLPLGWRGLAPCCRAKQPACHRRASQAYTSSSSIRKLLWVAWWRPKGWFMSLDAAAEQAYLEQREPAIVGSRRTWRRTDALYVPMLKENELIGVFTVSAKRFAHSPTSRSNWYELRRPGRHRHREHAAAQRIARIAAAADRDRRRAQGHQPLDVRPADRARHIDRVGRAALRGRHGPHLSAGRRRVAVGRQLWILPRSRQLLRSSTPCPLDRGSTTGRAALEGRAIHIPDVLADPEYRSTRLSGWPSATERILGVPLLREGTTIGVFGLDARESNPFTEKQIELVTTFADQAVIAIENVRLLNELRQRTDELGRSVDELRALGEVSQAVNSTLDLETVLSTIVAKAVQLSGTEAGAIYVFDDQRRRISSACHIRHGSGVN